ncbi:hypothetical protein GW17_00035355 [Ensete ventricosum]|nr:hypothetical protein GW17_00035355 [Ensete ventricosum]
MGWHASAAAYGVGRGAGGGRGRMGFDGQVLRCGVVGGAGGGQRLRIGGSEGGDPGEVDGVLPRVSLDFELGTHEERE